MQVGDGESQPTEGVGTIDDIAEALIADEKPAPVESDEGEESDEAEGSEAAEEEEQEADEEAEEEQEDDPTVKIKHDGKEIELKQSEVIELAQQGFDYTKKTMALAEERKAIEPIRQQAEEYRQHQEAALKETIDRLNAYAGYMASQIGEPPPISLAQQDAASYLAQKELHEARKGRLQQTFAEIQRLSDEQARQRQAWITQKAESTEKVLRDTLTGWNDDTLHELAKYAEGLGLTPQSAELAMLEPGFWKMAQKAKAYEAVQAQKAQMKPKAQLAKVDKPQAKNQTAKATEKAKRIAAFDKNPSVDALADILRS